MKKYIVIFSVIVSATLLTSCSQKQINDESFREGWTLVWEDDFNTFSDDAVWSKIERGKLHMNRYMSNNEDLIELKDGNIVLKGTVSNENDEKLPFLTGGISTEALKAGEIRRIEIRARINPVSDVIPYISLVPNNSSSENILINIIEQYGTDDFVYQSVSSEYTTTEGMADNPTSIALIGVDPSQYHIYGVERYPDSIVFIVDGKPTKKYPRITTEIQGQFPYNDLNFNLNIGLRLNREADPSLLPAEFYIDWVRYYEPLSEGEKL